MPSVSTVKARTLSTKLALQIVEHIRTQKLETGHHLTEQGLANALRVSRTPVRGALHFLEEMGVVEKFLNRGYFLAKSSKQLQGIATVHQEDELYLQLARDRLDGSLPSRITEADLMRRYMMPRARLLPLLIRMMHEGWLERLPGKGWEFQPILDSRDAHDKSYRFRLLIEPAALLEPNYQVNAEAFIRLRTQQQALLDGKLLEYSAAQLFEIASQFHETIVAGSGNPFLIDAIRRVNRLRRLIEYRSNQDRVRLVLQCKEHIRLLDLIESGDLKAAAAFLKNHLEVARQLKLGIESPGAAQSS